MKLNKKDAKWLMDVFQHKMGGRVDSNTMLKYFLPAREILTGKKQSLMGCSCHYKAYVDMTNSIFSQHLEEIKLKANPTK